MLITERHWQDFEVFVRKYRQAAKELAESEGPASLATATVSEWQFTRWVRGETRRPHRDARRILAYLFRPIPVGNLFAPPLSVPADTRGSVTEDDRGESGAEELGREEDMVTDAASESAEWAARVESSNVGPHTMEQLEADIRRIVTTYPNRPVEPLFHEVRGLRNRAFELLEGRQPPHFTSDLYVAAGVLCGILANASFDLGRYEAAETQARTAFMCAELAGHNGLRAWVRGLQALVAYWGGRAAVAVRLADSGADFSPESGTAHIRLASIKARAYGQLNHSTEAITALRDAENMRELLTDGDDLPGGMMAFPFEKQRFYASSTHLWLGPAHLEEAEAAADEAVSMFESAPPQKRRLGEMSLARMDLALARLGRGEIEGAAHQVHAVLESNSRRGTESVRKRLSHFTSTLAQHPSSTSPTAIGLREALLAHQHRSTPTLPCGGSQ
ncbi:hypothetical protein [Streptomyces sp. NRRL B-1347]|uniref:hypothetical protein n=1 Tax=Streptomyces sp. NRRL B-1347 TaxID=1476877 RepID=UPI001F2E1F04|nr:hypothetical protein [Streptomyces sp. NRRL B-1347]